MIESYQKGETLTQTKADRRAKEIAIAKNGRIKWNRGAWTDNIGEEKMIDSIEDLYDILISCGPIYGYYANSKVSHLIVVTGVDVYKNRVYTNNPWGVRGDQTYKEFKKGVAKKPHQSGKDLIFKNIYLVKK